MISSIAELLQALMAKEAENLDAQDLVHGPTIGEMYEGLTRDLLDRVIPVELDVRVVDGFIRGNDDRLSPQIDAMVVMGEGVAIPHTSKFVWLVQKVIAVFEVKKTLYGADLKDAFVKLRTVKHMAEACFDAGMTVDAAPSVRAFAQLTGHYPSNLDAIDEMAPDLSFLFHALVREQISPLRIILGFHGYVDELALRKGLLDYLAGQRELAAGFGVTSMPNMIVARSNSLVKLDGQPYIAPLYKGWWRLFASNSENPLRILIELLWAKLEQRVDAHLPEDDNLKLERMLPFLDARLAESNGQLGWEYNYIELTKSQMAKAEAPTWEPDDVETCELVVRTQIANKGELDTRDSNFRDFVTGEGLDPDALIVGLVERRVLAWTDSHTVRLVDTGVMVAGFMPTGEGFATNDVGLLKSWLLQEFSKRS